ncbi:MAG: helix-hairpin-helix domain-containing protein [candidate division WOR-3 bacterium]
MNNKEKAVLYFLIISLLIGSIVSLYKRQKEKRNVETITMTMSLIEKPDTNLSDRTEKKTKEETKIGLLDINLATAKELEALPGIGPVLAQRIVEERNRIGKFSTIEDLLKIKGIGKKKLAMIRSRIKIE